MGIEKLSDFVYSKTKRNKSLNKGGPTIMKNKMDPFETLTEEIDSLTATPDTTETGSQYPAACRRSCRNSKRACSCSGNTTNRSRGRNKRGRKNT